MRSFTMEPYREPIGALVLPLFVTLPLMALLMIPISICAGITTTLACGMLLYRVVVAYVEAAYTLSLEFLGRIPGLSLARWILLYMFPRYSSEVGSPALSTSAVSVPIPLSRSARHSRQQSGPHANNNNNSRIGQTVAFSRSGRRNSIGGNLTISPPAGSHEPTPTMTPHYSPVYQHRRLSSASIASVGSTSPDETMFGLPPTLGMERDFEGLGGWRFSGAGNEDEDAVWDALHSRLELPAYRHPHNVTHNVTHSKNHSRSHSKTRSLHHRHYVTPSGNTQAGTGAATPTDGADMGRISPRGERSMSLVASPRVANVSKVRVLPQNTRPLSMTALGHELGYFTAPGAFPRRAVV